LETVLLNEPRTLNQSLHRIYSLLWEHGECEVTAVLKCIKRPHCEKFPWWPLLYMW